MPSNILDTGKRFLASPNYLTKLLILSFVLHLGFSFAPLRSDDYLQFYALTGSTALFEKGFTIADPSHGMLTRIGDQFNFIDADKNNLQALINYGALPWWAESHAKVHFFRPLASLSHWLDYNFWPDQVFLMHLESLAIFLLLITVVYRLYLHTTRHSAGSQSLAALAVLFYTLDSSHNESLAWLASRNAFIAPLFGVLCIHHFILWREKAAPVKLAQSLIFLLLSLLSAEAGLATIGYLIGYLLWVDQAALTKRIMALFPALMVIMIWRLCYNHFGYGAQNVAHYIDPGRDLLPFAKRLIEHLPIMFSSISTGFDGSTKLMPLEQKQTFWFVSCLISAAACVMLYPVVRSNRVNRFWLTGTLIAIVPPCAINVTSSRVFGFVSIGFFMLLASFVHWAFVGMKEQDNKKLMRRLVASLLLFAHLGIPSMMLATGSAGYLQKFYGDKLKDGGYVYYRFDNFDYQDKHIMVLNSPQPFLYQIVPYRLHYEKYPIPKSIRTLAPGLSAISIKRLSEQELLIKPAGGFTLLSNQELPGDKAKITAGIPHFTRLLNGFWSSNSQRFTVGQQFSFPESMLEITDVADGVPLSLRVTLKQPPDENHYLFLRWDWQKMKYFQLELPAVGEEITLPEPFE